MSNNYRLFIGQLVRDVRRRELEDAFGKYGEIVRIDIKNGFGFIEYERSRDAEEAVKKMDGEEFLGKKIIVEYAKGKKREREERRGDDRNYRRNTGPERSEYRVIVEGLARGTSWQDLKDAFRSSGDILFTDVRRDKYDDYYGIVEFRRRDDIDQAIRKMDSAEINGSKIRVKEDRKSRRSRSRSSSRDKRRKRSRSSSRDKRRSKSGSRERSPKRRSGSRDTKRKSPSRERSPKRRSESPRERSSERKRSGSRDSRRRSGSRDSKPRDEVISNNEPERNDNNEGNENNNEPRDN